MAMQRIFICDERKGCTNPLCKMGGPCRYTTDSTHAAPETEIDFDDNKAYMRYWRDTEKDFYFTE